MMNKTLLLAAAVLFMGSSAVLAQNAGPAQGRGRMAACRDDAQKFCPDKHGPDRRACMQANKDKLSDGCKAAIGSRGAARGQ